MNQTSYIISSNLVTIKHFIVICSENNLLPNDLKDFEKKKISNSQVILHANEKEISRCDENNKYNQQTILVLTGTFEWLKSNLEKIYYSEDYDNIRLCIVSNSNDNEKIKVEKL